MKRTRRVSIAVICLIAGLGAGAEFIAPYDYSTQFRDHANEPPSRRFLLGTDELGRDRFSRLLGASRMSLLFASGAALASTAVSAAVGLVAGYFGGWLDEVASVFTDLFLSLPWLFALLTLRALLPLNASAMTSTAVTFAVMAAVGWASAARVVRGAVVALRNGGPVLHARAYGCRPSRLLWAHLLPNLKPVLVAQFWILVPVFLLTEANLGILGLGITEPMPSWGNMLSELQDYQRIPEAPWILAPAVLLILVVSSLHFVVSGSEIWE